MTYYLRLDFPVVLYSYTFAAKTLIVNLIQMWCIYIIKIPWVTALKSYTLSDSQEHTHVLWKWAFVIVFYKGSPPDRVIVSDKI